MNFKSIFLFFLLTSSIVKALHLEDKQTIELKSDIYYFSDIELKNNVSIHGENKFITIIKLRGGAKKALLYAKNKSNIQISNVTLINDSKYKTPLLHFEGESKQIKNITIKNYILKISYIEPDIIIFKKHILNIRIEAKKNQKIRRDYKQISCIRLQGVAIYSKQLSIDEYDKLKKYFKYDVEKLSILIDKELDEIWF